LWFERAGCAPIERQLYFSDEAHGIQAALAGQGVALANLSLLGDALRDGLLLQPFGPQLEGAGFHLVWPEGADADADVAAVRDWLLAQVRIASGGQA
jgi:LysR family glycine cleavage system transcriptional activator